ncbi:ankyrin repeat protein [Moumouvirus australiensis]|uniref:Ankyrin repeat protein n=1 Tax=Moumouvirus australiensis TaxID=2109587 RepID=A0A2P1EMU0_9VIRU|nr:ankyrin repeat protein [Moumouvirus australiensis]AVL95224.1 ankyrin repeat protein [Moumouvirus australiensis]
MSSELFIKLVRDHNKYHDGLNIETTEKLYFYKMDEIGKYLHDQYLIYLYDVYLPTDDPDLIIENNGNGKYNSNKLILQNRRDLREISTWEYIILNVVDQFNYCLSWACRNNYTNIIKYLVERGINVNDGSSMIELARREYYDNLKYLIENGANIESMTESLCPVIRAGNIDMVKYLIEVGADINGGFGDSIYEASIFGHNEIIRYLIENGANLNTINFGLVGACTSGNLEIIKYLLKLGADINFNNYLPLNKACLYKHYDVVKYLLNYGAIINLEKYSLENLAVRLDMVKLLVEKNLDKESINFLLVSACFCLKLDVIEYLIECEADIHTENDLPLIKAIYSGAYRDNKPIIQYLINNGANIHSNNNAPLITACMAGQFEIVKLLVDYGANIHTNSIEILKKTISEGHYEILEYLVKYGIDIYTNLDEHISMAKLNNHPEIVKYLKSLKQ